MVDDLARQYTTKGCFTVAKVAAEMEPPQRERLLELRRIFNLKKEVLEGE